MKQILMWTYNSASGGTAVHSAVTIVWVEEEPEEDS